VWDWLGLVFSALFVVAACLFLNFFEPPVYDLTRSATIAAEPAPECVERMLLRMPEIWSLEHRDEYSRGGGWYSREFVYEGQHGERATLAYGPSLTWAHWMSLEQGATWVGDTMSVDQITATRALMQRIETALEAQCGMQGLKASIMGNWFDAALEAEAEEFDALVEIFPRENNADLMIIAIGVLLVSLAMIVIFRRMLSTR
jgi:hypothetical protein